MNHFGEHLREARIKKGFTQQQVADHLIIDRTTYSKYENGKVEPHLATLWRVAQFLEVSTDALLRPDETP